MQELKEELAMAQAQLSQEQLAERDAMDAEKEIEQMVQVTRLPPSILECLLTHMAMGTAGGRAACRAG